MDEAESVIDSKKIEPAAAVLLPPEVDTQRAIDAARTHCSHLSFKIPDEKIEQLLKSENKEFWSYDWYQNEDGLQIKVSYASNKHESEALARRFLKKEVIGFDMEWKSRWANTIQQNVSLIQLACEDEVGLFHIAKHRGRTVQDVLAPSLRKIIEDPHITKTGVAILNADGKRLIDHMQLSPKGLFELSYLHRLVEYSTTDLLQVTKRLVALSTLAHHHLGFPLHKGSVRTSDWSKPLTESQKRYAASDAYVGYVLYQVMDAKRLKLDPTPPRPRHAELYLPILLAGGITVMEEEANRKAEADRKAEAAVTEGDGSTVQANPEGVELTPSREAGSKSPQKGTPRVVKDHAADLSVTEKGIFDSLREKRSEFARSEGRPPYMIASD